MTPTRKPTPRLIRTISLRMTGPMVSVIVHIAIVLLLVALITIPHPKPKTEHTSFRYADADSILILEPPPAAHPDEATEGSAHEGNLADAPPMEHNIPLPSIEANIMQTVIPSISPLQINLGQTTLQELDGRQQTAFGAESGAGGDLLGTLYDLKRDRKGRERHAQFTQDVKNIIKHKMTRSAFRHFYQVPQAIYFNHLLMDKMDAEEGPRAFGAEKHMAPSQFIVHYTGQIQSPASGFYRFAGEFDDILVVFINGKPVLEAGWGEKVTRWEASELVNKHMCYTGHPLVYGDWIYLDSRTPQTIDILIGEEPGGHIGGLLLVQQKNREYQTASNGRPLLPLFTVQPLTPDDRQHLATFQQWRFDHRPPPVMGKRHNLQVSSRSSEDDVSIILR